MPIANHFFNDCEVEFLKEVWFKSPVVPYHAFLTVCYWNHFLLQLLDVWEERKFIIDEDTKIL